MDRILGNRQFEWDEGNEDKNYIKHGIDRKHAEQIFLDKDITIIPDVRHSQTEERFIAIGLTQSGTILIAIFILRKNKIRIISVRIANKKERSVYEKEKIKENTPL